LGSQDGDAAATRFPKELRCYAQQRQGGASRRGSGADFQICDNAEMITEPEAVYRLVECECHGLDLASRFRMGVPGAYEHIIDPASMMRLA